MTKCETCGKEEREHTGHGRHPTVKDHNFHTKEEVEESRKTSLKNAAITLRENALRSPACTTPEITQACALCILADEGFCDLAGIEIWEQYYPNTPHSNLGMTTRRFKQAIRKAANLEGEQ